MYKGGPEDPSVRREGSQGPPDRPKQDPSCWTARRYAVQVAASSIELLGSVDANALSLFAGSGARVFIVGCDSFGALQAVIVVFRLNSTSLFLQRAASTHRDRIGWSQRAWMA